MASSIEYSNVNDRTATRRKRERWWFAELLAWLTSALMLAAIAIILRAYDGKPKPTLRGGITLNALVAVLVKIGTSFMIVPLSAALGQWKWNRVGGVERSLGEFSAISDATQSPWASIKLLFRFHGGAVAAVGALLVLCMQAVEPFVQQTIKYPSLQTAIQVPATLPISNRLQFQTGQEGLDAPPDFATKAGFYNGLFGTASPGRYAVTPTCTGVKCTWSDYYTLGFRSSCVNITHRVRMNNFTDKQGAPQTRYSLPNVTLVTPGTDTGTGTYVYNASFSGGDFGASNKANTFSSSFNITFLAVLGYTTHENSTHNSEPVVLSTSHTLPVADSCTLQLCVKKFTDASFSNHSLVENEVPDPGLGDDFLASVQPPGTKLNFSVDVASWGGLSDWLDSALTGGYVDNAASGENYKASADARDAVYQTMIGGRDGISLESLFNNVADSLTQVMRMANGPGPLNGIVDGTTYVTETVVQVQWNWFSLPFVVVGLILLYLLGMMLSSLGTPTWKDQTLATLCHGLDEKAMAAVAALQRSTAMEAEAKKLQIRLITDQKGSRLTTMSIPLADR
ncbi:MAG: hypothetical protein Q9191_000404 [Dirinaria sp. TL-2023a]